MVPFITVGISHDLYAFYYHQSRQAIMGMKSLDQGTNWFCLWTNQVQSPGGYGVKRFYLNITDSGGNVIRNICQPQAVVNQDSGYLYLVWADQGTNANDQSDIFFSYSTNGGTNWSTRVRLNDDTGTHDQWNPAIAIKPNGTQLFVGFYDRRDSGDNSLITTYGVIGSISGTNVTFGANFKVASDSFPGDSGYMSDYDTAAANDYYFYYTWGDNRERYFALNEFNIRFRRIFSP